MIQERAICDLCPVPDENAPAPSKPLLHFTLTLTITELAKVDVEVCSRHADRLMAATRCDCDGTPQCRHDDEDAERATAA